MRNEKIPRSLCPLWFTIFVCSCLITNAAAITGAPHPVFGKVIYECSGFSGASVSVTDVRTGESMSAATDSDGSWVLDLANLQNGYVTGDTLSINVGAAGISKSTSAIVSNSWGDNAGSIVFSVPPLLSISSPAYGATVSADSVAVQGSVDGTGSEPKLSVNGAPVALSLFGYSGTFSTTVPLSVGSNTISVTAIDCLGNANIQSIVVNRQGAAARTSAAGAAAGAASVPEKAPTSSFAVTNLAIYPANITAGKYVDITADVASVAGIGGTYRLVLKIEGAVEEQRDVALAAGEKKSIAFTVTRADSGNYNVSVDGQSGAFSVLPVQSAERKEFNVSSPLVLTPAPAANITATAPQTATATQRQPAFEFIFAVSGLLAVAYAVRRRGKL